MRFEWVDEKTVVFDSGETASILPPSDKDQFTWEVTSLSSADDEPRRMTIHRPCECGCDFRGGVRGVGYLMGDGATIWIKSEAVYQAMELALLEWDDQLANAKAQLQESQSYASALEREVQSEVEEERESFLRSGEEK